jgi:hypothetical protein
MADTWINIPDSGSPTWQTPVATASDLPAIGNSPGDVRITLDTDDIYVWTGSSWVPVASPGAVGGITALIGDVTATGPGAATATVQFVGGQSASAVATSVLATQAATSSDTPNTIVKRDGSGNFAAGTITASLTGNVTGNVSGSSSSFTGSLSGDVTGTQSATSIASTVVTGKLLTGLTAGTNTPITATNSILVAFENLQAQVSSASGSAITALTGDGTATGPGSVPFTLATVNSNVGSFGSSTSIPSFTVNGKGLITSASSNVVIAPASTLTGTSLATNVVNSSLTTVGTLVGGTWNATTIGIPYGGTGQTSAAAAFAALSPLTTTGDLIYENLTPAPARLPIGLNGQILTVVTGLPMWASPATSGTVTSVALALPSSVFTVSGSPVTSSGTLTGSFNTQLGNTFFAAPNGSSGIPTFRNIVAADVPVLNQNTTGTASNITATSNSSLTSLPNLILSTSQLSGTISLTTQVSGILPPANGGTGVANSFNLTIGGTSSINGTVTGSNSGDVTLSAVGSTPNANAATLTGQVLNLQPASSSFPGLVTTGTQTLAGNKTLTGNTTSTNLTINGTGGQGYVFYTGQSATPTTPVGGTVVFSDSLYRFSQLNTNGFVTTFDSTGITASRVYTVRDVNGKLNMDSRMSLAGFSVTTTPYTILSTDGYAIYFINTSTSAITINLPAISAVSDRMYVFKDISGNANTNNITIVPSGTNTIEGLNVSKIFQTNFGSWTLISDTISGWWMI